MEFLNFPIVALGAALICLIGVTIYALTQRTSIRNRDEQLVVARAQAFAMLELSQAGVLFLDREHKLMGEASAAAPELLGHTCATGTAFVQVIAELVDVTVRRETVAYLESMWKAEPTAVVDATANPLQKIHSGPRHLAIRFARLVVDGRVHHIIVAIERISAPRLVPHTIEVPVLDEETFARRLAGETGTRAAALTEPAPVQKAEAPAAPAATHVATPVAAASSAASPAATPPVAALTGEFELGPLDVTGDSLPSVPRLTEAAAATMASLAHISIETNAANTVAKTQQIRALSESLPMNEPAARTQQIRALSLSLPTNEPLMEATASAVTMPSAGGVDKHLATTITSPDVAPRPDASKIIDPPDARLSEVLREIMHVDAVKLDAFLAEARDKAGQLRAIIKLPAREPQAFREKLVLILELIRGIRSRAERLPLPSVDERAQRFEAALGKLRDKQNLSGNDFLPLAVKLDDLLSHLAIQGEVMTRLRDWQLANGVVERSSIDATQRSATATGTTIRQPKLPKPAPPPGGAATQNVARLSDLTQDSLAEMAQFLSDMYSKRVSLVCVGLEDVPGGYRKIIEKILGQLIHNAIRHGLETPADRAVLDKPEIGTVAVQFARIGADGYQLSVQDDGRGLDHDKIRAEAVRQGVLSADVAATIDPRKLASFIFRPGFTTVGEGGARGIGMDLVRDLVNKAGGKVGIATKPGEYTRFRITLPHEKKDSNAAVA
jgi:signal transduction histidine kinase